MLGEGTEGMREYGVESARKEQLLIGVDLLLDRYRDYQLTRGSTAYALAAVALRGQREGHFSTMIEGLLWLDRQPEKVALLGRWWGPWSAPGPEVIEGVASGAY